MLFHKAHKAFQRTGGDLHSIADSKIDAERCSLLHAHLLHFLSGQRNGLGGGADKAGAAARIAYDVPGVVVHHHFDQNVAGEQLVLHHLLLTVLVDLRNHLDGNLDVADQLLQVTVLHHGLQVVGDLVLVPGIGMHNIPKSLSGLIYQLG